MAKRSRTPAYPGHFISMAVLKHGVSLDVTGSRVLNTFHFIDTIWVSLIDDTCLQNLTQLLVDACWRFVICLNVLYHYFSWLIMLISWLCPGVLMFLVFNLPSYTSFFWIFMTVIVFFCIHQPAYSNQASAQNDGSKPLKSTEETLVGGPRPVHVNEIQRILERSWYTFALLCAAFLCAWVVYKGMGWNEYLVCPCCGWYIYNYVNIFLQIYIIIYICTLIL